MARITDPRRLERIKKAAMDLVVKYGYKGASICTIAKKAEVSTGYLYRYYNSKLDLIEELVESNIKVFENIFFKIIKQKNTAEEIIYNFVSIFFQIAINNPILTKFLCAICFDQNPELKKRKRKDLKVKEILMEILRLGIQNDEINPNTNLAEVELVIVSITLSYVSSNLDGNYNKEKFQEKQARRITEICLNALK